MNRIQSGEPIRERRLEIVMWWRTPNVFRDLYCAGRPPFTIKGQNHLFGLGKNISGVFSYFNKDSIFFFNLRSKSQSKFYKNELYAKGQAVSKATTTTTTTTTTTLVKISNGNNIDWSFKLWQLKNSPFCTRKNKNHFKKWLRFSTVLSYQVSQSSFCTIIHFFSDLPDISRMMGWFFFSNLRAISLSDDCFLHIWTFWDKTFFFAVFNSEHFFFQFILLI